MPDRGSEFSWEWMTKDCSDVPALKFHSPERALKFKEWFQETKVLNTAVWSGGGTSSTLPVSGVGAAVVLTL